MELTVETNLNKQTIVYSLEITQEELENIQLNEFEKELVDRLQHSLPISEHIYTLAFLAREIEENEADNYNKT